MEADEDADVQQDTTISLLNKKRLTPLSILLCNTICPPSNTVAGARQEPSDWTAHGTWGADFLAKSGIDIKYSSGTIEWQDPKYLDHDEYLSMAEALEVQPKEEQFFDRDWYDPDCFATAILDVKNEKVNTDEVVKQLTDVHHA